MGIWMIARIGSSEVGIEEAESFDEACQKAGFKPWQCEGKEVTDYTAILTLFNEMLKKRSA